MATRVKKRITVRFDDCGMPDVVIRLLPNYDDIYEQVGGALDRGRVPLIVYRDGGTPPPTIAMTVLQAIGLEVLACSDFDAPDADMLQAYAEAFHMGSTSPTGGPRLSGSASLSPTQEPTPRRKAGRTSSGETAAANAPDPAKRR